MRLRKVKIIQFSASAREKKWSSAVAVCIYTGIERQREREFYWNFAHRRIVVSRLFRKFSARQKRVCAIRVIISEWDFSPDVLQALTFRSSSWSLHYTILQNYNFSYQKHSPQTPYNIKTPPSPLSPRYSSPYKTNFSHTQHNHSSPLFSPPSLRSRESEKSRSVKFKAAEIFFEKLLSACSQPLYSCQTVDDGGGVLELASKRARARRKSAER